MTLFQGNLYKAPVNNCGLDPLSGFDFEVFVQDSFSGERAFFGKFQSLTLSVRNATETYLELGQRIPIYLDGEIQIAWVLEQGLVDMAFIARTFGVANISRCQYITRGPRFHVTFDANAVELSRSLGDRDGPGTARQGINGAFDPKNRRDITSNDTNSRKAKGRYELMRCKPDSVSLGIMPGRRVAAVRWEGVAEGITFFEDESVQEFKEDRAASPTSNGSSGIGGFTPTSGLIA
jgi:hypothetical protein